MITHLDHIAVAVGDMEKGIKRFMEDFGLSFEGQEDVAAAKTSTAFFPIDGTQIELIHPLNNEGPVVSYLEKNKGRGGLHHVAFRSDDLEGDIAMLKEKGYAFLSEAPSPGAHNSQVIFIHPKCCDGVLIELCQHPEDH